jgi:hypothetical protein
MERGAARVEVDACARCHAKAAREHRASRHGMGLHSGWGCTRALPGRPRDECAFCHREGDAAPKSGSQCALFLKQTPEVAEGGCNACHRIESSCATCHSSHATDLAVARDPRICARCHMGPDHPQWEAWETSMHGAMRSAAGERLGPSCQACHMAAGSHDVSRGIATTFAGTPLPAPEAARRRDEMVAVCARCHAPAFARRELTRDDAVRDQARGIVAEAEAIVRDLADHGLLDPMPADRPPHPQQGARLVTDAQMLYEDTSRVERLFFELKSFDFAKTFKGAYHQSPDYLHWHGVAAMKMRLTDIRAEASRLRERGGAKGTGAKPDVEAALRALKAKADRGEITPDEHRREKARLLGGAAR